jgi:nucleoid DNA-binding protein
MKYGRRWLIRELARRARFTQSDIAIILKALSDVMYDIVKSRDALLINGLFVMWVKEIAPHRGWDGIRKQPIDLPKTHRLYFSPSKKLILELHSGEEVDLENGIQENISEVLDG